MLFYSKLRPLKMNIAISRELRTKGAKVGRETGIESSTIAIDSGTNMLIQQMLEMYDES